MKVEGSGTSLSILISAFGPWAWSPCVHSTCKTNSCTCKRSERRSCQEIEKYLSVLLKRYKDKILPQEENNLNQ